MHQLSITELGGCKCTMVSVHRYFMWNSFFDLFENDLDVEIDGRYVENY